jgi:hypothetical protein
MLFGAMNLLPMREYVPFILLQSLREKPSFVNFAVKLPLLTSVLLKLVSFQSPINDGSSLTIIGFLFSTLIREYDILELSAGGLSR